MDESIKLWDACKVGSEKRLVVDNTTCENVFLCKQGSLDFIELDKLCNGKEDCGEERTVCMASRLTTEIFISPVSLSGYRFLLHCIPGLKNVELLLDSPCIENTFFGHDYPMFGASNPLTLKIPLDVVNCDSVYGELYVYLSCSEKCIHSSCIVKPLRHDSCSEDFSNKAYSYTLAKNSYLTVVVKEKGKYHNNVFQCTSKKCVGFEKLCNLVNDCGDHSDEVSCTNSFQCNTSMLYIPLENKCDGKFDCMDYSDECNEACNKEIISGHVLKVLAWAIGSAAVLLNLVSLCKSVSDFRDQQTNIALINKTFKTLISTGDFLTGLYLLMIASVDLVLGGSYCKKQIDWLTSEYCAILGIMSTTGGSLSLYSMTSLSIFRVVTVKNWRNVEFVKTFIGVSVSTVVLTSVTIALMPLVNAFEDFYVNGMVYNNIRLFIGPANKKNHYDVFRAYYGKLIKLDLTWVQICKLFSLMFTDDYGSVSKRKIHFYGNEGVCLFKYFVKSNDPQRIFVWMMLSVNLMCFVIISVCYSILNMGVKRSRKAVSKMMAEKSIAQVENHRGNTRLQKSITRIIVTDFFCWIPLLLCCTLHSLEFMDGTVLYSLSSILILPLNSVINPMIYDNFISNKICDSMKFIQATWTVISKKRISRMEAPAVELADIKG